MDKNRKNIVVLEPSKLLFEGISLSIIKMDQNFSFFYLDDLNDITTIHPQSPISAVLINPTLIQNRLHEYQKIKSQFADINWIGIIYSLFEMSLLKRLDDTFFITDDIQTIIRKINSRDSSTCKEDHRKEELSERELDILRWIVQGLTNKETADKMNLSIHTVNTHRRNIMDKTGIKSVAGLTVFAASKGLIDMG